MSVHKDKNNTYYVKYKNTTKRGFKTKREAKQYESLLFLQNDKSNNNILFSTVTNEFLKSYEVKVKKDTFRKAKNSIDKIIKPAFNDKPISKITELDCNTFYEQLSQCDYSTAHKNYIIRILKMIFKHAIKYYRLTNDPTYVIEPFKSTHEERMKKRNKEFNIFTYEEFQSFIDNIDNETYRMFFIILFFTGLRLGEILALQWKDYNDNMLHIYKAISKVNNNKEFIIQETKTVSSIRDITLGETLGNLLDDYKSKQMSYNGFNEEWFIFGKLKPLSRTTVTRIKDKAIDKAKLKRITLHEFRHSHASNLIGDGVDIVEVSRRLGHSNITMTLNTYTHAIQKNRDKMNQYLDKSSQILLKK